MKRLYVLAISICIILLFNICAYADSSIEVSINTDKYQYKKSDTIKMKLSLDKNCGCAGLVIKLNYDPNILQIKSAKLVDNSGFDGAIVYPDDELISENGDSGKIGFAYVELDNNTNTGDVVDIELFVKKDIPSAGTTISYEELDASDIDGNAVSCYGKIITIMPMSGSIGEDKSTDVIVERDDTRRDTINNNGISSSTPEENNGNNTTEIVGSTDVEKKSDGNMNNNLNIETEQASSGEKEENSTEIKIPSKKNKDNKNNKVHDKINKVNSNKYTRKFKIIHILIAIIVLGCSYLFYKKISRK